MSYMFLYMINSNFMIFFYFISLINLFCLNSLMLYMYMMTFFLMKMIFFSLKEKMLVYFFIMKKNIIKLMFLFMLLFFSSMNLIFFYIFFEIISLLIFFLVYLSSFSIMRMKASIYMFVFMSIGTLPMLVMIFFINEKTFLMIFILSFSVKMPIVFLHLWLPKAHVEANYYDSMILASLLLKLGGYGMLIMDMNFKLNFFFLWGLFGSLIISFMVLFLLDVKMIMAFSSIIHMNIMLVMFLNSSVFMEKIFSTAMLSHALISSMMFYMIGMIYDQSFSRNMFINKNFFLNFMFFFNFFFLICFINMGSPMFMSFFSEMYTYMFLIDYNFNKMNLLIFMIMFFSCMLNLYLLKNLGMMVMSKFFKMFNLKLITLLILKEHLFYLLLFF
uniref:NADH-ubiquinone oxidoreductase chain 4 n=1 Tax=Panonychus ulmi TaxID=50024 RepID=D7SGS3_PANUL|nr:NADH dehydrogenase subunit 4 [Panonychus ulmi]ACD02443.1 NADH dehydrogenase subunit 4 [Panonychus ulmi]